MGSSRLATQNIGHSFQPQCESCRLNNLCLPIAVASEDLGLLEEIIDRGRPLHRGDHVFRAGDAFDAVYAVRSGTVKSYSVTTAGEEQIIGFHMPGEIFGLGGLSSGQYSSGAIALETAAVCRIPFEEIEPLSRQLPSLQRHLFHLMSREIQEDQQLMLLLGKKTAEERIASLLLSLSSRLRRRGLSGARFRLPMSRGEMGNYLGLVVETVSRVLTRLQNNGVLKIQGREVEILEPKALADLAGTHWQTP